VKYTAHELRHVCASLLISLGPRRDLSLFAPGLFDGSSQVTGVVKVLLEPAG
jgi:hypothetical protein